MLPLAIETDGNALLLLGAALVALLGCALLAIWTYHLSAGARREARRVGDEATVMKREAERLATEATGARQEAERAAERLASEATSARQDAERAAEQAGGAREAAAKATEAATKATHQAGGASETAKQAIAEAGGAKLEAERAAEGAQAALRRAEEAAEPTPVLIESGDVQVRLADSAFECSVPLVNSGTGPAHVTSAVLRMGAAERSGRIEPVLAPAERARARFEIGADGDDFATVLAHLDSARGFSVEVHYGAEAGGNGNVTRVPVEWDPERSAWTIGETLHSEA